MSYNLTGTITTISKIESVGEGKKLTFRVDTGEQYSNLYEFELYKGADYVEHLDKFTQYNKVGDFVDVEFNLRTFNWKPEADNKIFTSLSCWKVEKAQAQLPATDIGVPSEEIADLPF